MNKKQKECEHLYPDASDNRFCVDCGKKFTRFERMQKRGERFGMRVYDMRWCRYQVVDEDNNVNDCESLAELNEYLSDLEEQDDNDNE